MRPNLPNDARTFLNLDELTLDPCFSDKFQGLDDKFPGLDENFLV